MNVATLTLDGDLSDTLSVQFAANGSSLGSSTASSYELHARIREGKASGRDAASLLPNDLLRAVRQWYAGDAAADTLAIVSRSPALDAIPWERMPSWIGLPGLAVVRVLPDHVGEPVYGDGGTALLVAGWLGAPTLNLAGVQKELATLGALGDSESIGVRVLAEPSIPDFIAAWTTDRPRCVHIAAPAVVYQASGAALAVSGVDELELVPIDDLLRQLGDTQARVLMLNTCDGAFGAEYPSAARLFTEMLGATTISWYGMVGDLEAADFARFFYSRMLERNTAVNGIRAFNRIRFARSASVPSERPITDPMAATLDTRAVPVIWSPSIDALTLPPLAGLVPEARLNVQPRRRARTRDAAPSPPVEPATASVEFQPQRWLNPALLKNQSPAIVRLVLNADRPLHGVRISITCDAGSDNRQSLLPAASHEARSP